MMELQQAKAKVALRDWCEAAMPFHTISGLDRSVGWFNYVEKSSLTEMVAEINEGVRVSGRESEEEERKKFVCGFFRFLKSEYILSRFFETKFHFCIF